MSEQLSSIILPSRFQPDERVAFGVYPAIIYGVVKAVKFCSGVGQTLHNKTKYDLELDGGESGKFRVYGIDSDFVLSAK